MPSLDQPPLNDAAIRAARQWGEALQGEEREYTVTGRLRIVIESAVPMTTNEKGATFAEARERAAAVLAQELLANPRLASIMEAELI